MIKTNEIKESIEGIVKLFDKLKKDNAAFTKSNKSLANDIILVKEKVDDESKSVIEAKKEVHNIKKCLYSVQKDNFEIKKGIEAISNKISSIPVVEPSLRFGANTMHIFEPPISRNSDLEYSQDDDFYMDDDIRLEAEKIKTQKDSFKSLTKIAPKAEDYKVNEAPAQEGPNELQEIDYDDLKDILSEFIELEDQAVDGKYSLALDCDIDKHLTLMEMLCLKLLPHINSISFSNIENNYEIVSKFLYINHFTSVNTVILNEYSTSKISLEYYITSLQNMFADSIIFNCLTIKEVEISGEMFNMLLNMACTSSISLEIQWANITGLDNFKIEVPQEHHRLWALEISYRYMVIYLEI